MLRTPGLAPCPQRSNSHRPGSVASRSRHKALRPGLIGLQSRASLPRGQGSVLRVQSPVGRCRCFMPHARTAEPCGRKPGGLARKPECSTAGANCLAPEAPVPCVWLPEACGQGFPGRCPGFRAGRCTVVTVIVMSRAGRAGQASRQLARNQPVPRFKTRTAAPPPSRARPLPRQPLLRGPPCRRTCVTTHNPRTGRTAD